MFAKNKKALWFNACYLELYFDKSLRNNIDLFLLQKVI